MGSSARVDTLCTNCSLKKYLEGWRTALNEAGPSVLMLIKGSTIPRIELNTVHLKQQYSLFMHNKLQYTWRGDYCECVRPAQLPILTWGSSSVPAGTTSTIRSPAGPRRIQQNYLVSDAKLIREERATTRRGRECSTIWEAIGVRVWTDTAGPAFQREPITSLRLTPAGEPALVHRTG